MTLENLAAGKLPPKEMNAIIEIPENGHVKYEIDKETGLLKVDRILHAPMAYPANYGYFPGTLGDDGDPLDVLVLCGETIYPHTLVRCYPIGVITMIDNGRNDEKIIAIPFGDPTYNQYRDISDLPQHIFEEMVHFFNVYKALEDKEAVAKEVNDREAATAVIASALENYINTFCK